MQEELYMNQEETVDTEPFYLRLDGLDTLRGLAILSMTAYHACWDLVYLFGKDWPWFHTRLSFLWQQSICWTFILLSGFCFRLAQRHLRQGFYVFVSGALVTAVTTLAAPDTRIWFGVLSLLGAATLLTIPFDWLFYNYVPGRIGLVVSFSLFALSWNVPNGSIGLSWDLSLPLPASLYLNNWTACLGFPPEGFASTDYFPLLPWLFLFWTGYFLFDLRPEEPPMLRIPLVTFLGRHSLCFYLLHQPILYAALEYWTTGTIRVIADTWAFISYYLENSITIEILREYWPQAWTYLRDILERILS